MFLPVLKINMIAWCLILITKALVVNNSNSL